MIVEGLKITLLGVGVVFLFLSLLVVVIKLASRVLKPFTAREEATYNAVPSKKPINRRADEELQRIMAVINAAIAAHRARKAVAARIHAKEEEKNTGNVASAMARFQSLSYGQAHDPRRPAYRAGELFFRDRSTLGGYLHHR